MADQNTSQTAQTAGEAGKSTNAAGQGGDTAAPNAGGDTGTKTPGTTEIRAFTQADVDRAVKDRLAEEQKRAARAQEDALAKARGEFEKLAEQRGQRVAELEAQLAEQQLAVTRATVAARHRLPPELVGRLRGATESELEADAKELTKLVMTRAGGADGGAGRDSTGAANPNAGMNAFLRRAAGKS